MASEGLRFAMLTTFYPPYHFGGDAMGIRRLAHALVRRGHRVDVIHDVDAFDLLHTGDEPAAIEEPEGLRVHRLRSASRSRGRLSCLLTQQLGRPVVHGGRIRTLLAQGDYDVVHFHNTSLVGGPGLLAYGPADAVRLYTAHEHWLVCASHVLWRHDRELCTGKQCIRCQLHFRRPPQLWRHTGFLERQLHHVDVFTSPSAFSAAKHREFGFPRELEVVPYFLPELAADAEVPAPDPADAEPERPYFLFVGRLEKIKGLQDVIPLFGADAPADLWVVGTGNYEAELRQLAEGRERVRFLGRRSPEALRSLYRGAQAVVVPSLCYETFGIILLEAFREGTPVVARSLGPLPEIVRESGGGILFDDAESLRSAFSTLAGDAALRDKLGRAGHTALRERWTERVVVRQYLELVGRIARERGLDRVGSRLGERGEAA